MPDNNWFKKRVNDTYLKKAHKENYRSRAAYKLKEIVEKYDLFKNVHRVLDAGAAPGSWTQVAVEELSGKSAKIVAVDLIPMESIEGAIIIQGDIRDNKIQAEITSAAGGLFEVIISDMAPNTSGVHHADSGNSIELVATLLKLSPFWLKPGGSFAAKVFEGPEYKDLQTIAKSMFEFVKSFKPKASLSSSREIYLVCKNFVQTKNK
ncbi:MAG: RlmE family RNA methyltransferase [Candidatus Riflebacteria bacterium]|nr:RlmE family RNA methyltransferase [Candidatus Riflebacteria bacterium]